MANSTLVRWLGTDPVELQKMAVAFDHHELPKEIYVEAVTPIYECSPSKAYTTMTCVKKYRDGQGKIFAYELFIFGNNNTIIILAERLKTNYIRQGWEVNNLTLTSDNRLVDSTPDIETIRQIRIEEQQRLQQQYIAERRKAEDQSEMDRIRDYIRHEIIPKYTPGNPMNHFPYKSDTLTANIITDTSSKLKFYITTADIKCVVRDVEKPGVSFTIDIHKGVTLDLYLNYQAPIHLAESWYEKNTEGFHKQLVTLPFSFNNVKRLLTDKRVDEALEYALRRYDDNVNNLEETIRKEMYEHWHRDDSGNVRNNNSIDSDYTQYGCLRQKVVYVKDARPCLMVGAYQLVKRNVVPEDLIERDETGKITCRYNPEYNIECISFCRRKIQITLEFSQPRKTLDELRTNPPIHVAHIVYMDSDDYGSFENAKQIAITEDFTSKSFYYEDWLAIMADIIVKYTEPIYKTPMIIDRYDEKFKNKAWQLKIDQG